MTLTLSRRLTDHVNWVATVNRRLAEEAGGLSLYRAQVRSVIDQVYTMVAGLDADDALGLRSDKMEIAKKTMSGIRFGLDMSDYVFVVDSNLTMVVHPDKNLVGRSVADMVDAKGKKLFQVMVDLAKAKGEGFLTYHWAKVGSDKPVPKITFVKMYQPWNWVIGTGIFLDDTNQGLVDRVDDFIQGKPFSLQVQLDPTKCAFGQFLASEETTKLKSVFPEFRQAMEDVSGPHRHLHESAVRIEEAVNNNNMSGALKIFDRETAEALVEVKKFLDAAVAAEEKLNDSFREANRIYATTTSDSLAEVQDLLHQIRETAKQNIMSDEVMLKAAEGTQRNVIIIGLSAIVLAIVMAWLISTGLVKVLGNMADDIGTNSDQVTEASGQVSQASQSLAEGASEQAASLEETSASMEEMSSMTQQNADNASQANALMEKNARRGPAGRFLDEGDDRVHGRHLQFGPGDRQDHQDHRRDRLPDQPAGP